MSDENEMDNDDLGEGSLEIGSDAEAENED